MRIDFAIRYYDALNIGYLVRKCKLLKYETFQYYRFIKLYHIFE